MRSLLLSVLAVMVYNVFADLTEVPEKFLKKCDVDTNGTVKGVKFTGNCNETTCTLITGQEASFQLEIVPDLDSSFFFTKLNIDIMDDTIVTRQNFTVTLTSENLDACDNEAVKIEGNNSSCNLQAGKSNILTITHFVPPMLPGPGNITVGVGTFDEDINFSFIACVQFAIVSDYNVTDNTDSMDAGGMGGMDMGGMDGMDMGGMDGMNMGGMDGMDMGGMDMNMDGMDGMNVGGNGTSGMGPNDDTPTNSNNSTS